MSKLLAETQFDALAFLAPDSTILGTAIGSIAGLIIGAGISLTVGLFYSAAAMPVLAIVALSALMGALFGHVMGSMLAEDISLLEHVPGTFHAEDFRALASYRVGEPISLSGGRLTLNEIPEQEAGENKKAASAQDVMLGFTPAALQQQSSPKTSDYATDVHIFELIVAAAQRSQSDKTPVSLPF